MDDLAIADGFASLDDLEIRTDDVLVQSYCDMLFGLDCELELLVEQISFAESKNSSKNFLDLLYKKINQYMAQS